MDRHPGGAENTETLIRWLWEAECLQKDECLQKEENLGKDAEGSCFPNSGALSAVFFRHNGVAQKFLDLGAGSGEAVRRFRELGFEAWGVDLEPRECAFIENTNLPLVQKGDFCSLAEEDDSMDVLFSQCALYVSGRVRQALSECRRVLRTGGYLLLADLDEGNLCELVREQGFEILRTEDMTAVWKEYYLRAIWEDSFCCDEYRALAQRKRGTKIYYTMLLAQKRN